MGKLIKRDGEYLQKLRAKTRHKASVIFNERCVPDLAKIAVTAESVKDRLAAMNMLGKLSGDLRPQPQVAVNIDFGNLYERLEQNRNKGEVIDIFSIKDVSQEEANDADNN